MDGYDLIVLGSGPGGESVAIQAAKLGAKVAVVEKKMVFGGPTGLSSKAVREATKRITLAIDQIGGDRRRQINGLWKRRFPVLKTEAEAWQAQETRQRLLQAGIDLYIGEAELIGASKGVTRAILQVCRPTCCISLETFHVVISTGSKAHKPSKLQPGNVPINFLKNKVIDTTEISTLTELPKSVVIIGGGVIAVEYATVLAELSVGVTLICPESSFLPFLEKDLMRSLKRMMKKNRILIVHLDIKSITLDENTEKVKVKMDTDPLRPEKLNRIFTVDTVIYSGGRDSNSENLGLENVGILTKKYGRIEIDENYRTTAETSIYAIGDVIGPPGLASAAVQQGRYVADKLFGPQSTSYEEESKRERRIVKTKDQILFGSAKGSGSTDTPLTLWTIPELSSVGKSKVQALEVYGEDVNIVEGLAYFKNCARGRLSGSEDGFLKLVAKYDGERQVHSIIGVHIIGEGANELIQLGSCLVHSGATLEAISNTPFSAVTLSILYQVAADDALVNALTLLPQ